MVGANKRCLRAVVLRIGQCGAPIANPLPQVEAAYAHFGVDVTSTTTVPQQAKLPLLTVLDYIERPP